MEQDAEATCTEPEMNDLPDEVWVAVFALLEPIHTAAVTLTCRRWRCVFHSDPPLWRAFHERLLGGPRIPAILTAPALPEYNARVMGDQEPDRGNPTLATTLRKRLRAVEREGWFGDDEWRVAVEWKVRRVRQWGVTPEGRLEWAARLGCTRLVATLLRRYRHELSTTGRAQAAFTNTIDAAVRANDMESVELLLQRHPVAIREGVVVEAVRWGNVELLRLLIQQRGMSFDRCETPLYIACSLGHVEVAQCLLETYGFQCGYIAGSLPTGLFAVMPDSECRSALCRAARGGHLDVVKLFVPSLLGKLAPWEASNALWSAAKEGRNEVIRYLLDSGVKPSSPSPITAYARLPRGALQATTLVRLIESVPDIKGRVWTEMVAMAWEIYTARGLAFEDRLKVYRLLESNGADINAACFVPGIGTTSPLLHATLEGDEEMAEALRQCGADPRRLYRHGIRPTDFHKANCAGWVLPQAVQACERATKRKYETQHAADAGPRTDHLEPKPKKVAIDRT